MGVPSEGVLAVDAVYDPRPGEGQMCRSESPPHCFCGRTDRATDADAGVGVRVAGVGSSGLDRSVPLSSGRS